VCRDVVHELWNVGELESVGAVVTHSKGDFSLGATNSTLVASPGTSEPMLVYSGGSQCMDSDSTASTVIRVSSYQLHSRFVTHITFQFICSESEFGSGSPQLIAALPVTSNAEDQCQFFFEWKTHVACPTNPKQLQGHWTAIGLLLVL
jgi:cation-dependent mannose-6-phosphate receptor